MSSNKVVLSGNQAVARGFYEAGGKVAASYPGSPTVEMLDYIQASYKEDIYAEFSTNEKVALEVAIGGSMSGVRSIAAMKHVGVNIAMDPLMTFTQTDINGGFLLMTGDDPGMASSQNEQDNRVIGKFANMAIWDPADAAEAKEYTKAGLQMSEEFNLPVMLRITSRVCHARGVLELQERVEKSSTPFAEDASKYCMIPPYTFPKQYQMKERLEKIRQWADQNPWDRLEHVSDDCLIITSGLPYLNLMEVTRQVSTLKLSLVYPLPIERIRKLAKQYKRVLVIEEMTPFIENELTLSGIDCEGKRYFPFTGELSIEVIEKGLVEAGVLRTRATQDPSAEDTTARGPLFCAGCPHRPVFDILKKAKALVVGDIGCYSLGMFFPFEVLKTNISMGASLGMIKGMRKGMDSIGDTRPLVGVIGDGTFFHSGLPGFANLRYKLQGNENITMIILDNGTTAMTGGQPTAGSKARDGAGQDISIDEMLRAMGFENVQRIDQFRYKEAKNIIGEAMKREGLDIIITSRPCALKFRVKQPHYYVDPEICIGCRTCIKTNCPPLRMINYEGFDKPKSSIDPTQCVGCSICAQVCPVHAIKRSEEVADQPLEK